MDSIQTIILAIVQGITELLPISSTGHMVLVSEIFFKGEATNVLFLTVIQFGTTLAILFSFRDFIFQDFFNKDKWSLYKKIAVASIPAITAGLLLDSLMDQYLYKDWIIALMLLTWGIAMIWVSKAKLKPNTTEITKISYTQAILIGLAQAVALIPGTSRSGSTTVVGMLTGIEMYTSLRFSFLLGLPVLLGSFIYEVFKYRTQLDVVFSIGNIWGIVISGLVGYLSILLLNKFSKKNFLLVFGVYRIVLAIFIFMLIG